MKFKLAVVQFDIKRLNPEENIKKAEDFMKRASDKEADLIVFPEDVVTDPLMDRQDFADSNHNFRSRFQELAKKYTIDVVPGSFIEEETGELYNTTYYIDASGEVLSRYRKINLWLPERSYITPGNELSVFDTRFGKVGLIICWDIAFPELFREMVKQGVKIVLCPSYWCYGDAGNGVDIDPASELKLVDAMSVSRAYENEIVFAYCNAAGKPATSGSKNPLIGHSQIALPILGCIKKLEHNREEMFIEEIDMSVLEIAEESKKIREDVMHREVK